jgi:hypothetical protein
MKAYGTVQAKSHEFLTSPPERLIDFFVLFKYMLAGVCVNFGCDIIKNIPEIAIINSKYQ